MHKFEVIMIMGKAGSGKDSLAKDIVTRCPLLSTMVVSATTRPPREGEVNGVNYWFMSEEEFHNTPMIETTCFNNWYYGTPIDSLSEDKVNIIVCNPIGVQSYLDLHTIIKTKGIYLLDVSDKERLLRQLKREENPNVSEIIRRYTTDLNDFNYDFLKKLNPIILKNETLEDYQNNIDMILDNID